MKKIFTTLCALMLMINLSAQTESGTFYISLGNAFSSVNSYNYLLNSNSMSFGNEWTTEITVDGDDDDDDGNDYFSKDETNKTSTFNLGGQFGYFITDGLLAGIGLEYGSYTIMYSEEIDADGDGIDDEITDRNMLTALMLSPFAKYYINLGSNALFISSSFSFGTSNMKSDYIQEYSDPSFPDYDDEYESLMTTSRLSFGTGMAFFLNESISLEPSVNYAISTYSNDEEVFIGNTTNGNSIYDTQERKLFTNAFYLKIAATMYL